jgi:hypothetical protein
MTLPEKRARAGQIGGITTALRHQGKHSEWGKLGGRRPLPTLAEIEAERPKGGDRRELPNSIPALLRLWKEEAAYGEGHGLTATSTTTTNKRGSLRARGLPKGE